MNTDYELQVYIIQYILKCDTNEKVKRGTPCHDIHDDEILGIFDVPLPLFV